MIYERKYTVTQPPTCPRKWDHLYAGDRRTTVKDRKREIGKGLFNKVLADLGIDGDEFRGTE